MGNKSPQPKRALVLDPDMFSGEGLRLLCEELGYAADVIRVPHLLPPAAPGGTMWLTIVDTRIADSDRAVRDIAARIDALTHSDGVIVVLGKAEPWSTRLAHRRKAVIAKPFAPAHLLEVVRAFQPRG